MNNSRWLKFVVSTCLTIGILVSISIAQESELEDKKRALTAPKGVAPLTGMAIALSQDAAESANHEWSLRLTLPKVMWEIVGIERPKSEWTKIKADVEMRTLELPMAYPMATQLAEVSQNRLVDLRGKRLDRAEALKRLGENAPILVSVSGEMPDPFYLQCVKPETLIVLIGLPSAREYELLPRSRNDRQ